jgi:hypothetical protein
MAQMTWTEEDAGRTAVIRMRVTPAAEPSPAFRYRIVQRPIDQVAGNAAPFYYRAHMELSRAQRAAGDRFGDAWHDWYGTDIPLAELPLDDVREAARRFDSLVENYLVAAVARRDCDWQWDVEDIRGPELFSFFLEEAQESRGMARGLALLARLAVAEGRYDDALRYLQINYRVGSDVASEPFIVCTLIGTAIVGVGNVPLLDLIAAPDSPNLYWALSELPRPPVDYRQAILFEFEAGLRAFPFLDDAETTERSAQEWARLWHAAWNEWPKLSGESGPSGAVAGMATALLGYPHAKQRLIDDGMDPDRVEQMPVGQVMAVYTARAYERITGELEQNWLMPYGAARQFDDSAVFDETKPFGGGTWQEFLPIGHGLLPAISAARNAEMRLQRDVDAIRVIEALRLYAADNAGRLPERLSDVTQVPVPVNPATNEPFSYRLEDGKAILELPESDGIPNANRRFEITINDLEW